MNNKYVSETTKRNENGDNLWPVLYPIYFPFQKLCLLNFRYTDIDQHYSNHLASAVIAHEVVYRKNIQASPSCIAICFLFNTLIVILIKTSDHYNICSSNFS